MRLFLERLVKFFDDHLPDATKGDEDARRRGRMGLWFAAVFFTQAPIFALLCALVDLYVPAACIAITGVALAFTPWVMRRSLAGGNRYVLGWIFFVLVAGALYSGGPRAPGLAWMAAIPVMATMTRSIRAGINWLAAVVAVPVLLTLGERFGISYPAFSSFTKMQVTWVVALSLMQGVLFALAVTYEVTRASMFRALHEVNDGMRLVLDNVEQGFVTVERAGLMGGMRSAILDTWLGPPSEGESIADWIGRTNAATGGWLRMGLDEVFDGFLPVEVTIEQLPKRFDAGDRLLELAYRPIHEGADLHALVVIVSDVTERAKAERAEADQLEFMSVFSHLMRDRSGTLHFFDEAADIVARLKQPGPSALRLVHTLKGNCAMFGLRVVASVCHEVESGAQDEQRLPNEEELARVRAAWGETLLRVGALLSDEADTLGVVEDDLVALEKSIRAGAHSQTLLRMLQELRHERAAQIFGRLGERAEALGRRIGHCAVRFEVRDHNLRFSSDIWSPVWSAMVHAVRNAVDHGGQSADERVAQGKPAEMCLLFESAVDEAGISVVMSDDGRGIDWERVRDKARRLGIPSETEADLHEALFQDGLSTRDEVTELSGRGVGLSALREACAAIGASVTVDSRLGRGTRIEIRAVPPRFSLRATG